MQNFFPPFLFFFFFLQLDHHEFFSTWQVHPKHLRSRQPQITSPDNLSSPILEQSQLSHPGTHPVAGHPHACNHHRPDLCGPQEVSDGNKDGGIDTEAHSQSKQSHLSSLFLASSKARLWLIPNPFKINRFERSFDVKKVTPLSYIYGRCALSSSTSFEYRCRSFLIAQIFWGSTNINGNTGSVCATLCRSAILFQAKASSSTLT